VLYHIYTQVGESPEVSRCASLTMRLLYVVDKEMAGHQGNSLNVKRRWACRTRTAGKWNSVQHYAMFLAQQCTVLHDAAIKPI
jgi:hypothetical protein